MIYEYVLMTGLDITPENEKKLIDALNTLVNQNKLIKVYFIYYFP